MIKFKCRCSHPFEVPDDQAGASVQCPACGLLVDVPTLTDLPNLADDGTFRMLEDEEHRERNRLNTLYRVFTRDHVDATTGEEIDLRLKPEEIASDRLVDPMAIKEDPRAVRPKYDPVTGELIRPLDVAGGTEVVNPASIPKAAAVVAYADVQTLNLPTAGFVAMELFMPINAAVMFFVALAYAAGFLMTMTVFLFMVNLPIAAALLAHYGGVIEETGPEGKDELPRPLRHLEFGPDLWWPFVRMLGAVVICYGPAVFILVERLPWQVALLVAFVGSVFCPAVMLTTTTSGSAENLRPDRVMGVISTCGVRYVGLVVVWTLTLAMHLWTWVGIYVLNYSVNMLGVDPRWLVFNNHLVVYPMIGLAIYSMHVYCWYLGIQWRRHHQQFPWVLQQHAGRYQREVPRRRVGNRSRLARPR